MPYYIKRLYRGLIVFCLLTSRVPLSADSTGQALIQLELSAFREAYPRAGFALEYDDRAGDWRIRVESGGRISDLYYAEGRYLSPDQVQDRDQFRRLLYRFPDEALDPSGFTERRKSRIADFGSTENRSNGPVTSPAFFNALHDIETRRATESHLVTLSFLRKRIRVHSSLTARLNRLESRIRELSERDGSVAAFLDELGSASGFAWRTVRDTPGRSFHSMGLALDFLPADRSHRIIYWNWEKRRGNDQWMMVPLQARWSPPDSLTRLFEEEGFIWGGKWALWDNMHYEYRPELIAWRRYYDSLVTSNPPSSPLEAGLGEDGLISARPW